MTREPQDRSDTRHRLHAPASPISGLIVVATLLIVARTPLGILAHPGRAGASAGAEQTQSVRANASIRREGPLAKDPPAEELLALARRAISGRRRVEDVRSLVVEQRLIWDNRPAASVISGHTLLLPDRYQMRLQGITHTLDAAAFWQTKSLPVEIVRHAEANIRREFARRAIGFLVRPLHPLKAKFAGHLTHTHGVMNAIDFTDHDERVLTLLLDTVTHRPRALLFPGECGMTEEALEDYREVKGVFLPFGIRFVCGDYRARIKHTVVKVDDPAVTAGLFAKP